MAKIFPRGGFSIVIGAALVEYVCVQQEAAGNENSKYDSAAPMVAIVERTSLEQAREYCLVILAMGLACGIQREPDGYSVEIESEYADAVANELRIYEAERDYFAPPDNEPIFQFKAGFGYIMIWATALFLIFLQQRSQPRLTAAGASDNLAIFNDGEYWRVFTALFLHKDFEHLFGNLVSGAIICGFASKVVGARTCWTAFMLCGAGGNLLTAFITRPEEYTSIGASTGVFAIWGMLAGFGVTYLATRARDLFSWKNLTPLLAAGVMLGWTGSGNAETDIFGHVFGFTCGLVFGLFVGILREKKQKRRL